MATKNALLMASPNLGGPGYAAAAKLRHAVGEPALPLMPVSDKKVPLLKSWPLLMPRLTDEELEAAFALYPGANAGLCVGPACGPGGDVVLEADSERGARWLHERTPPTPIMTETRRPGVRHLHFAHPDGDPIRPRNDVLGSHERWKDQLRAMGYAIDFDHRAADREAEAERAREERERADREQGPCPYPLIDLKAWHGMVVAPGSVHSTGFVYKETRPWTPAAWSERPVFNPAWLPEPYRRRRPGPKSGGPVSLSALRSKKVASPGTTQNHGFDLNTRIARAHRYLGGCAGAISGQGGHRQTFSVACAIARGFDLDVGSVLPLLREWSESRCEPPWSEAELLHKIESALNVGTEEIGGRLRGRRGRR